MCAISLWRFNRVRPTKSGTMLKAIWTMLPRKRVTTTAEAPENNHVRHVAAAFHNREEFQRRAAAAALVLGSNTIDTLVGLLRSEHTPPDALAPQFAGLGAWLTARQFAIFEVFYHFGAPAVPTLLSVIRGDYDWTQGNAIEILCRLYAKGAAPASAFELLKETIPSMREEALIYAAGPLHRLRQQDTTLSGVLEELLEIPEFSDAYQNTVTGTWPSA